MSIVPDYPKDVSVGFFEGFCNLKCPKCEAQGKNNDPERLIQGVMEFDRACFLFDELKGKDVVLAGGSNGEPLLQKDFIRFFKAMKDRGSKVIINTNGLLMKEEYINGIMDLGIDCVFISIDALTKETYKRVRGIEDLDKVNKVVFDLLRARGKRLCPRIGVSFVVEESNAHEEEDFISFWLERVDVVRVARLYSNDNGAGDHRVLRERKPCSLLYNAMVIHHDGTVPVCCWDANGETNLGNVFEDGIKGVWHGKAFQTIRHYHETGQFAKVPFCAGCQDWVRYEFAGEKIIDGIMVRRSPLLVYHNRLDRLGTWKFGMGEIIDPEKV